MHTGHIILVKGENHQDALERVSVAVMSDGEGWFASNWSDWAVVGDTGLGESRWEMSEFFAEGTYTGEHKYVLSYETERELFCALVDKQLASRKAEFDRIVDTLMESGKTWIHDFELDEDTMDSWYLRHFANLATGIYTSESKIFDLENHDANLKYFRQDVEAGNTDWFAVVVDFHY